jgi:hypothetical protein
MNKMVGNRSRFAVEIMHQLEINSQKTSEEQQNQEKKPTN